MEHVTLEAARDSIEIYLTRMLKKSTVSSVIHGTGP